MSTVYPSAYAQKQLAKNYSDHFGGGDTETTSNQREGAGFLFAVVLAGVIDNDLWAYRMVAS